MGQNRRLPPSWINVLIFAVGLFLLNVWTARIFGDQVKSFLWTNGILAIAGIAGFFFKLFPEKESRQIQDQIRKLYFIFVSRRFLIWFYVIFILVSTFVTAVVIEKGDYPASVRVHAASASLTGDSLHEKILEKSDKSARFIRIATPFGRTFHVLAKGYAPKSVRVYPWVGKTIHLDEDLSPSLALWVRFPVTLINTLLNQCRLIICNGKDTLYNVDTENGYGSLLIGRKIPVSENRLALWAKEASVYYDVQGADLDLALLGWQTIRYLEPASEIDPDQELKFYLQHTPSGMTLANGFHKAADWTEIDILLRE